jgi:hypothetical protein
MPPCPASKAAIITLLTKEKKKCFKSRKDKESKQRNKSH